jgi:hypothetical protein
MFHAVQGYNNPSMCFKSEIFIVSAMIAWTYLMQYYYLQEGIDYRYFNISDDGEKVYIRTKHGAYWHWSLEDCLKNENCPLDEGTKQNILYLIQLRHEIEHQMTRKIDGAISPKLQACAFNFNRVVKELFGERFGLDRDLSLALQFTGIDTDQQFQLMAEASLPSNVIAMQKSFEEKLGEEVANHAHFAYRVAYVPIRITSKGRADSTIEFVRQDEEEDSSKKLHIKEVEAPKYKPNDIVNMMKKEGFKNFTMQSHTELWREKGAKRKGSIYGVFLREREGKDWWWYPNWIKVVREHCQQNQHLYIEG